MSRGYGLRCTPTAQPLSEKVTAPVKGVGRLRVRSTTLRSNLQRPTLPNGRWPRLASRLGWRSMGTGRSAPRPSRYYGRRQDLVTRDRKQLTIQPSETSIVPPSSDLLPAQIDKSVLAIAEPKRMRDKGHLRFVA